MTGWELPVRTTIGGKVYGLHADYRDVLEIIACLEDPNLPEYLRWRIALALFYEERIPEAHRQEAMDYLCRFLNCGETASGGGPTLLDWQQDAGLIVADVNKVAGQEIRNLPYLHWWTFLGWFLSIGEGNLSTLVSIRDKLLRGKKLEPWEQTYYHRNKARVKMQKNYSAEELAEQEKLKKLLG